METQSLSERVDVIMRDALFKREEIPDPTTPPEDAVLVEGVVNGFGFHHDRLESHREEVREILTQMPDAFMQEKGGGMSFLALCNTSKGEQWGEHRDMEALCCLAIGLGLGKWLMKDMAEAMPGGMPYISFNLTEESK